MPRARDATLVSTREVAFFGLQAVIPAAFALLPSLVFLIAFGDIPNSIEKLTDGTLVLISFTMLISLSQDLQQAVPPRQKAVVERLELLLRISAIVVLGTYTLLESVSMAITAKAQVHATQVLAVYGNQTMFHNLNKWMEEKGSVQICISIVSFYCFALSIVLSRRVLKTLRPHFIGEN